MFEGIAIGGLIVLVVGLATVHNKVMVLISWVARVHDIMIHIQVVVERTEDVIRAHAANVSEDRQEEMIELLRSLKSTAGQEINNGG